MTNFHEADNTMQPRSFVGAIINVTDSERQHPPLHPHVTPSSSSSTNLFMMQRFLPLPLSLLWLEAPEWISRALMDATEDQHQHRHPALVSACYLPAFATLLQGSSSQTATSMSPSVSVFSRETTSWYLFSAWVVLLKGVVAMYHALHWFHVAISLVQWSVERGASVGLSDDGGGGASAVKAPRCHTLPHPDDLRDVYDDVWIGRYIRKLRSVTSADSPVTVQTTNHWRRRRRQSGARARASTSIRKWLRKVANGVKRCGSVLQKVARGLYRRVSCCCGGQEGDTQFSSSTDQHTRIISSSNPRSSTRQSNPAAIGTQSFSNANDVLYSSQHHHQRRTYSNPIVVGTRRSLKIFNAVGSRSSAAAGAAGMRGDGGLGSPQQRNSFFSSTIPHVVDPTVRVAIKMFHDAPAINSLLLHRATTSRVYAALVGLGLLVSAIGLIFFALLRDNNNASLNSVSFDLHMTPSLLQRCSSWLIGVGGAVGVPCFLGIAITGCVGFRVQRQGRSQLLGLPRSSINSEEFHRHIVQDFDALMRSSYTVHRTTVPANLESQHRRPTKAPQQQQQDSEEKRTSDLRNTDYFAKMMKHHKGEPAQLVSTAGSAASASAVASSQRRKSQRLMETEQLLQGVSRSSGHSTRQQKNFVVTGPITVLMRKCLCVLGAAVGVAVVGCCVVSGIKIAL
ncbi:transmembrane protein, putative [Bodo saltans]|uniref:Transmembrane protein, putative n=1 Tax=Bodo saltans TaxID=75058 RepID=A0A0S4IKC8_BODSA|nr:transmembrane protein, putative [Bodo saltans]|eukprot:CUE64108.1 transmembrane protein, putative [Bodo saltans]